MYVRTIDASSQHYSVAYVLSSSCSQAGKKASRIKRKKTGEREEEKRKGKERKGKEPHSWKHNGGNIKAMYGLVKT